jgi:hypothetical protein
MYVHVTVHTTNAAALVIKRLVNLLRLVYDYLSTTTKSSRSYQLDYVLMRGLLWFEAATAAMTQLLPVEANSKAGKHIPLTLHYDVT